MTKRQIAFAVGAVVLVAGVVAGRERPALELIQERTARTTVSANADGGIDLERRRRGEPSLPQVDPFSRKGLEAPKQAAKPDVPAKPVAPPLPFRYFGRLTENGKSEVFVMRGDELLSIEAGKTYGEYRVDKIADSGIGFTYLPLKTKQTLELQ